MDFRLLLSYDFDTKPTWVGAVFGGVALTALTYFILMKGIKGTSYAKESFDLIGGVTIKDFLENNVFQIVMYTSALCLYFLMPLFSFLSLIFIK